MAYTESIDFFVDINRDQIDVNKAAVNVLVGDNPTLSSGDVLKLSYHIYIDYLGAVKDKLDAILSLLNAGCKGSFRELTTGQCLINDILSKMNQISERNNNGS